MKKISKWILLGVILVIVLSGFSACGEAVEEQQEPDTAQAAPDSSIISACNEIGNIYADYEAGSSDDIADFCIELLSSEVEEYGWPSGTTVRSGVDASYAWLFSNSLYHSLVDENVGEALPGPYEGNLVAATASTIDHYKP
jgi:hypothetical protein